MKLARTGTLASGKLFLFVDLPSFGEALSSCASVGLRKWGGMLLNSLAKFSRSMLAGLSNCELMSRTNTTISPSPPPAVSPLP